MVMAATEESPRSPEAKVGMQVEDLWDIQEPQLSPTEKLNACFESIPVSAFPPAPSHQGIRLDFARFRKIVRNNFNFREFVEIVLPGRDQSQDLNKNFNFFLVVNPNYRFFGLF